jgi:hypothetical protein
MRTVSRLPKPALRRLRSLSESHILCFFTQFNAKEHLAQWLPFSHCSILCFLDVLIVSSNTIIQLWLPVLSRKRNIKSFECRIQSFLNAEHKAFLHYFFTQCRQPQLNSVWALLSGHPEKIKSNSEKGSHWAIYSFAQYPPQTAP